MNDDLERTRRRVARKIVVAAAAMRALKPVAEAHGFATVQELLDYVGLKQDRS